MSYANGRLPASALAPIPGGRLRKDAARSWNAMRQFIHTHEGVWIRPTSSRTAYRSYADQVYFWNLYKSGKGALAAVPGTSLHGEGLAVDTPSEAQHAALRKWGHLFGWGIAGGKLPTDAPSEDWHAVYHPGVWRPAVRFRPLKLGATGPRVKRVQEMLRALNVAGAPRPSGYYNRATRRAVVRFQSKHGLPADGVVGPKTWRSLRRASGR